MAEAINSKQHATTCFTRVGTKDREAINGLLWSVTDNSVTWPTTASQGVDTLLASLYNPTMYKILSLKRMSLFSAPVEKDDFVYVFRGVVDSYKTQMMQICWNYNVLSRWTFCLVLSLFCRVYLLAAIKCCCYLDAIKLCMPLFVHPLITESVRSMVCSRLQKCHQVNC